MATPGSDPFYLFRCRKCFLVMQAKYTDLTELEEHLKECEEEALRECLQAQIVYRNVPSSIYNESSVFFVAHFARARCISGYGVQHMAKDFLQTRI